MYQRGGRQSPSFTLALPLRYSSSAQPARMFHALQQTVSFCCKNVAKEMRFPHQAEAAAEPCAHSFYPMCGAPKGTLAVTRATAARALILVATRAAPRVRARSRRVGGVGAASGISCNEFLVIEICGCVSALFAYIGL